MDNKFTIAQLVDAAEQDVRPVRPMAKTAAVAPAAPTIDLLKTESVMALAKVAKQLAYRLKLAEDMEGSSGVNTGSSPSSVDGSLVPSTEIADQHKEPTGDGPPDLSPPKNQFSIPNSTGEKPGEGSLVPGPTNPEQTLMPTKAGNLNPIAAVHQRYAQAAAQLAKLGNSPQSIPDQVKTDTGAIAGPGKPEEGSTRGDTNAPGGPPNTAEGVRNLSRQETYSEAASEAGKDTGGGTVAATKNTVEGDLDTVLKAAAYDATKAAALRNFMDAYPTSKLACALRGKLAAIAKTAQDPTKPPVPNPVTEQEAFNQAAAVGATPDLHFAPEVINPNRPQTEAEERARAAERTQAPAGT
jgi:hypothetical protein